MMSKIKSGKLASVKFLIGFLMAAGLVVAFACEQKDSVETETLSNQKTTNIKFDGHTLLLSGDSVAINELMNVLNKSGHYQIAKDNIYNEVVITAQSIPITRLSTLPPPPPPPVTVEASKNKVATGDEVFYIVEEMPQFPGGDNALLQFIAQNVKYPTTAMENGIQGKIIVNFIVEKDGKVSSAKIARAVDPALDAEALRVVNSLPKFKPGKQRGKAVRVQYTVPINFVLQ